MKNSEKDKSDEGQNLISKDIDRRRTSVSQKFKLHPLLTVSVSIKTDSRGYKSSLHLTQRIPPWKTALSLCPETNSLDLTVSRCYKQHTIELSASQHSVEVAIGKGAISAGGMWSHQGITPMVKVSRTVGKHRISLACGYAGERVDYYFNLSCGMTRIGIPFRVPLPLFEGISFSFFLLSSVYLLSQLIPSSRDNQKPRARPSLDLLILFAVTGPSADIVKGTGKDIGPVLRLLVHERVEEIAMEKLVEQGFVIRGEELRVDFEVEGMSYCAWFGDGEVVRFRNT